MINQRMAELQEPSTNGTTSKWHLRDVQSYYVMYKTLFITEKEANCWYQYHEFGCHISSGVIRSSVWFAAPVVHAEEAFE